MITALLLAACGSGPPQPPAVVESPTPAPAHAAYWVERSDVELDDAIRAACSSASDAGNPVLLTFSAPWCGDCKRVRELEQFSPLREELMGWGKVVVHVGRFDRHDALREAFEVGSIAHWVALEPNCTEPVTQWRRLRSSVFEPASNPDGARTPEDLTDWLIAARSDP